MYVYSFTVYIVANIILGFSPNLPILFAFRGMQAFGSASVVSIGQYMTLQASRQAAGS